MKISADPKHPDYHNVVNFIDKIYCDNTELKSCVRIDIAKGEAECITYPIVPVNGMVPTHTVKGAITFTWRAMPMSQNKLIGGGANDFFSELRANWQKREWARAG